MQDPKQHAIQEATGPFSDITVVFVSHIRDLPSPSFPIFSKLQDKIWDRVPECKANRLPH